jgi:hypothetical protein
MFKNSLRVACGIGTERVWRELKRVVELIRWRDLQFQIAENFKAILTTKFIDYFHAAAFSMATNLRLARLAVEKIPACKKRPPFPKAALGCRVRPVAKCIEPQARRYSYGVAGLFLAAALAAGAEPSTSKPQSPSLCSLPLFRANYFLISAWRLRMRVSITSQTVSCKSLSPSRVKASASRPEQVCPVRFAQGYDDRPAVTRKGERDRVERNPCPS